MIVLFRSRAQDKSTAAATTRPPPTGMLKLTGQQARARAAILRTKRANRKNGDVESSRARFASSYFMYALSLSPLRKVVGGGMSRGVVIDPSP